VIPINPQPVVPVNPQPVVTNAPVIPIIPQPVETNAPVVPVTPQPVVTNAPAGPVNPGGNAKPKPLSPKFLAMIMSHNADLDFYVINIGSDKGLKNGQKLTVFRNGKDIGKIEVTRVQPLVSIVVPDKAFPKPTSPFKPGDKVMGGFSKGPIMPQPAETNAPVVPVSPQPGVTNAPADPGSVAQLPVTGKPVAVPLSIKRGDITKIKPTVEIFLAANALKQGRYAQAIELYRKAVAKEEAKSASDWVQLSNLNNLLGMALNAAGQYDKALEHLQKALAIFLKQLGPHHLDVAFIYNNIGLVHRAKGRVR
jgi:hypothetical protein